MTDAEATPVTREAIAATHARIRPHIRRTPVLEISASDLGFDGFAPLLKPAIGGRTYAEALAACEAYIVATGPYPCTPSSRSRPC